MMKMIRAGRGLGDSLYLQSVVRHLTDAAGGKPMRVASDYPDVFRPLGERAQVVPFTRAGAHIVAHYTTRKRIAGTTQFRDCCIAAGIQDQVDLRLDWRPTDLALIDRVRQAAGGRPVVCVQLPRSPMARLDGFGDELLPECSALQRGIDRLRGGGAFIVQIGAGKPRAWFGGIDLDLANKTTVAQMIDVASIADAFLGYVSFIVPLAESLSKPALLVWSRRGSRSMTMFVRQITPEKIVHKSTTRTCMDDAPQGVLDSAVDALLQ